MCTRLILWELSLSRENRALSFLYTVCHEIFPFPLTSFTMCTWALSVNEKGKMNLRFKIDFSDCFSNMPFSFTFSLHYYFLNLWMNVLLGLRYSSFRSHWACNSCSTTVSSQGVGSLVLWSFVMMRHVAQPRAKSLSASGFDFELAICKIETK